jgi:hypothetical protein
MLESAECRLVRTPEIASPQPHEGLSATVHAPFHAVGDISSAVVEAADGGGVLNPRGSSASGDIMDALACPCVR